MVTVRTILIGVLLTLASGSRAEFVDVATLGVRNDGSSAELKLLVGTEFSPRSGPKLRATGFFRAEKVGGKWWLVDPEGHLFFSLGVTCVYLEDKVRAAQRNAVGMVMGR